MISKPTSRKQSSSRIGSPSWRNLIPLASLIAVSLVGCQPAPQDAPVTTVLFQEKLDALQKEYGFPGATAAYALADGTFGVVATGQSDVESETRMLPTSRMLAASIGKMFVSANILALAQENRLNLDDPISVWLGDESWFARLANHEAITIRQLLNHSSGLLNHVDEPAFAAAVSENWANPEMLFTPEKLVGYVLDQPAVFPAGDGWSYTDTGYILLGLIIEKVAGRTYYEEVTERFLDALDLELTSPSDRRDLPGLAAGYMAVDNMFGLPPKTIADDGRMPWNPAIEWTGGGLASNSLDLARWAKLLFEGEAMEGPYLDDLLHEISISPDAPGVSFGAGIAIRKSGPLGAWYSHGGWIPGYTSSLRYYPEHRTAIVFQINTDIGIVDDSTDLYDQMAAQLEQIIAATATE